jgi:hypothetical protein
MAAVVDLDTRAEPFRPLVRSAEVFTGFRWQVVRVDGQLWDDEALLAAVYDALRPLSSPGVAPPGTTGLARQLVGVADKLSRSLRAMRGTVGLNLFTDNVAEPSPVVRLIRNSAVRGKRPHRCCSGERSRPLGWCRTS